MRKIPIRKIIKIFIISYIIYALLFGVLIFSKPAKVSEAYKKEWKIEQFLSPEQGTDSIALIETPKEASEVRVDLIRQAQSTIDVCYHSFLKGESTDVFIGLLEEAADRGVKVRILLDDLTNGLKRKEQVKLYLLQLHPNIEVKYYQKVRLLEPWNWNDRLHEKYMIVDDTYVLLGGRNIGDRFMDPISYTGEVAYDREVLIINTKTSDETVVTQVQQRFDSLWESHYTFNPVTKLTKYQYQEALEESRRLKEKVTYLETPNIDWLERAYPTNKITLLYTPLEGIKKEPTLWYDMMQLMYLAQDEVIIQSPYFILTHAMKKDLAQLGECQSQVKLLTNSMASTPNYFAFSGYLSSRKFLVNSFDGVYEYQGPGSIHAKSIIIDDNLSLIGSFNMDARSTYLSTETMLVVDSEPFNEALREAMNDLGAKSLVVNEDYQYEEVNHLQPTEVSTFKKILLHMMSWVTYWFSYML